MQCKDVLYRLYNSQCNVQWLFCSGTLLPAHSAFTALVVRYSIFLVKPAIGHAGRLFYFQILNFPQVGTKLIECHVYKKIL